MSAKTLKLSTELALPLEAVTQKLAWIGTTGSGKTYGASKLAELMWDAGAQFVVLDPVGVWYGLRLAGGGKKPSDITIPIFGGLHGDVPLEPTGGAMLADLIVDRGISAVLDVSQFETDTDKARFATGFGQRFFFRKKSSPSAVHLFVEECQEFVPENEQRGEEHMKHAFIRMQKIGRNFGIGTSLITQRPQDVSKKALNLAQTLFVFRTTGSHERKAIDGWIKDKAIADQDISQELPKLKTGRPHVWSPEWLEISEVVGIIEKRSFNASATPEVGAAAVARELAPIDLERIRTDMAATIEKAKAEDPKLLRDRIAKLERELATAKRTPVQTSAKPDPARAAELAQARVDMHALQQRAKQLTSAVERLMKFIVEINAQDFFKAGGEAIDKAAVQKAIDAAAAQLVKLAELDVGRRQAAFERWRKQGEQLLAQLTRLMEQDVKVSVAVRHNQPFTVSTPAAPRPARPREQPIVDGAGVPLKAGARRMLQQLATFYPRGLQRSELGTLAGVQHSGGTFSDYLSALRSNGYIEERGSAISLTDAGLAAAGDITPPQSTEEIVGIYSSKLKAGARRMLDLLVARHPEGYTRAALGAEAGVESSGGTFSDYLSSLRSAGLLDESQGDLRAAAILFLEGAA